MRLLQQNESIVDTDCFHCGTTIHYIGERGEKASILECPHCGGKHKFSHSKTGKFSQILVREKVSK